MNSEKLELLWLRHRHTVLRKARIMRALELQHWWLSVFWDDMDREDMMALGDFLKRPDIEQVLGVDILVAHKSIKADTPPVAAEAIL